MEKLLNIQVLKYVQDNSLLSPYQSGFLPNHSTVTQLCFLIHEWQTAVDDGENVQATFLDLSKAYDRLSIPGMISKIATLGFSYSALSWISAFLKNRQQWVKINEYQSSWMLSKPGIPQGTVLGPILFLIFLNDLPQSLTNKCSIFADDTTYTLGRAAIINCQNLSSDLLAASEWAAQWGMMCSAEKSEHQSISNKSTCAS